MRIYKTKLIQRIRRTPTIESFRLLPEEKIDFIPGQFMRIVFDQGNRDNKELNKHLSFSSSPTKEYIEFTKRVSDSPFCQRLKDLEINAELLIEAPLGNCVFKDEYKKISFLIGGIGITPVISIIEYIIDKKLDTDVCLLYSNRTEEEIAFKKELDFWQSNNKNIKLFYTITEYQPKDKNCIFGRIDKHLLSEKIRDPKERIFFIFGPPKMVEAMKQLCKEIQVADERIKTESFIGY